MLSPLISAVRRSRRSRSFGALAWLLLAFALPAGAETLALPAVTGLGDEAISVVIDLNKLAGSVRALPESAWGLGGFAIKATTVRWLDATDDLKRVTISVGAKDKVVQAKVMLTLGGAAR